MNRNTFEQDAHMPRWAYRLLALAAAVIGLACSAITAKFFIIGLERTESDSLAREALILAGVLMIVVELAAFGMAALLPRERLKALRWRLIVTGAALVIFECATIYAVQVTLVHSSNATHQGASSRIAHLQATIAQNRSTAAALVRAGSRSGESAIASSRIAGMSAIQQAGQIESRNAALSAELARLQSSQSPTLTTVLGHDGMIAYSVARAVLITAMGLVMFAAAGALLRAGRAASVASAAGPLGLPAEPRRAGYAHGTEAAPAGVPAALPSAARRWLTAGVPMAAIPAAAFAAPGVTVTAPAVAHASHGSTVTPAQSTIVSQAQHRQSETVAPALQSKRSASQRKRAPVEVGSKRDSGVSELDGHRYRRIVASVRAGRLKPSIRAIQTAEGGGTATVRGYMQQMERDGVIERTSKGYALRGAPVDPRQMNLIGDAT